MVRQLGATGARRRPAALLAVVVVAAVASVGLTAGPAAAAVPTAPTGVAARVSGSTVVLTWRPSADPDGWIRTYEIERNGQWVAWVWGSTTTWTDRTANLGATNSYRVYATDNQRGSGARSAPAVVGNGGAPSAPSNLRITAVGGRPSLSWGAATDPDGPIRTYEVERDGAWVGWVQGSVLAWTDTSVDVATAHSYRVYARDGQGTAGPRSNPATTPVGEGGATTMIAAGDIGQCGGQMAGVASLLASRRGVFAALGDLAYPDGSASDFANCYHPYFGPYLDRTRPTVGNHEYETADAGPYFDYFGSRAGARGQGWYSYDVGRWHVVVLNSECWYVGGCGTADPQYRWLQAELAANNNRCLMAYWHRPLLTTESGGEAARYMAPYFDLLDTEGADVLLVGHAHVYERWARMNSSGQPAAGGIRMFTVGTGGAALRSFGATKPGLEKRGSAYGALELTLNDGGYSWQFLRTGGDPLSDSGSDTC